MGLAIVIVEALPAPRRARPAPAPAPPPPAPAEPVAVLDGDWLVLRLGGTAPGRAVPQPEAPRAPAPGEGRDVEPPPAPPRDTYVVQPGDTLTAIAQRELGSARLADELARLNGIADPTTLRAGQVLRLR